MNLAPAAEVHDGQAEMLRHLRAARAAWLASPRFRRLSPVTIREYARISGALLSHLAEEVARAECGALHLAVAIGAALAASALLRPTRRPAVG